MIIRNVEDVRRRYNEVKEDIKTSPTILARFEECGLVPKSEMTRIGGVGMAARASGNDYVVDIVNMGFDQWTRSVQNPYLAMRWLITSYLTYDMPSWNIEIGDVQQTALGIQRNRQQTISFPVDVDMDMMQLVKTHIGNGEIDKAEVNLSSRQAKVQLKYDTYDRE